MTSNMSFLKLQIHLRIALCTGVARTNQTSGMGHFAKIVHGFKLIAIFAKRFILQVGLVLSLCCCTTVMYFVFGALFYSKFSVSRILSWHKYLYKQWMQLSMAKFCHSYFYIVYVNFVNLSTLKKD